jgi:NAD binding domain of 6-phosphogluconate dehydrogenase/EthD domain
MHIAFLGLGKMGVAVARHQIEAKHELTVWNRTPERAQPLIALGARLAGSPAEAVADAEIVFTMVIDDAVLINHHDRERKQTMIKLSILMVRRSDLTYEQYIEHWRDVHGPLFAAQPASKQYVRKYIKNHVTGDTLPGTTATKFDGIAETCSMTWPERRRFSPWTHTGRMSSLMRKPLWIASVVSCYLPTNTMLCLKYRSRGAIWQMMYCHLVTT